MKVAQSCPTLCNPKDTGEWRKEAKEAGLVQDEVRAAGGANELEPDVPAGDTERALIQCISHTSLG